MSNNQMQVQPQAQAAVASTKKPIDVLKGMLQAPSVQAQFANALGKHRDTFIASIVDLYTGDKALQTCDPKAVIAQALKAAVMKLPINKALGFAYIVVYNNSVKDIDPKTGREVWRKVPTPTFIPGYKGYIQLAMRTGQYRTINADMVYEGEIGKVDKLSGAIRFDSERTSDKIIGYFCHFELLNGFQKTLYMTVEEMAAYAKRYSPSVGNNVKVEDLVAKANAGAPSKQVGWMGNFNDMALKTCIRRLLSKYGYLSVEMQGVMADDIEQEAAAQRNDRIADGANVEVIDLDETQYDNVDKDTGEVVQADASENASKSASENEQQPDY